ncbi:MAG: STAS domain-containing protein [Xanthomonadales bacterium]|nr:STAS domain-containing protein [Xanthomonadales bacterium]
MAEKNGCTTVEEGGFQVVKVQGEVDLSWSQKLRKSILDALGKSQKVAVDLSQVTYIDSSGIAALVEGFQSARGKGQHFSLVSVSQPVIAVLELARLDRVFPIFESLDLAAQS